MARISYEQGIRCKRCGNVITTIPRFSRTVLCQGCGAHLMDYEGNNVATVTNNADIVTVKVTHKWFSEIYEVIRVDD